MRLRRRVNRGTSVALRCQWLVSNAPPKLVPASHASDSEFPYTKAAGYDVNLPKGANAWLEKAKCKPPKRL